MNLLLKFWVMLCLFAVSAFAWMIVGFGHSDSRRDAEAKQARAFFTGLAMFIDALAIALALAL